MWCGVGVVCCTTCVRDCVCLWLLCVVPLCVHVVGVCVGHVCDCGVVMVFVCVCSLVCLCVVCVAGWCVGVRVRLDCDGVGVVAVAWTRVCMCFVVVAVVVFAGACVVVCVRCGLVCVAMVCGRCRRRWLVWMHVYCVGWRRLTGGLVAGGRCGGADTGCTAREWCVCGMSLVGVEYVVCGG
jgi:hypothetical protein